MTESGGRRRISVRAAGRVGEPNVLSNAVTPNVLSGTAASRAPERLGANVRTSPTEVANDGAGRRLPSFGTILFLGFLAITGFRLLGEFAQGLARETPAPTTAPAPVQGFDPGRIVFGAKSDGDCGVFDTGDQFIQGTEVWWSAELPSTQSQDVAVVIVVRRDGREVDREDVPPDPAGGAWTILCSGAPVFERSPGLYRVEVWDETVTVLQAVGEYRMTIS